ncbi:dihydrolipoyllysine-residue acetyltransferase [Ochrobactrum sp. RH2CCR150]|uniref:dihydrolipoyllysine-residue acetyltransferase n=1 Tax=Ochrobactrum sp. RH2CCR150 TaxID=2587044 RepID=UPI0015F90A23|nr:pyruvate dehydrogenase E2 component (dihydrolipoamide acetyltransferase) [Ochrobactrum sp. RH2CCR150]
MGVQYTVELPDIGDYKDVPVVEVLIKPGDAVAADQSLIVLESDKATIEVPSPVAGKVVELLVEVGKKVSKGVPVIIIEAVAETASAPSRAPSPAPVSQSSSVAEPTAEPAATVNTDARTAAIQVEQQKATTATAVPDIATNSHATPSVRAFARQLGVDLSAVKATGPSGRILRGDVQLYVKAQLTGGAPSAARNTRDTSTSGIPPMPSFDFSKYGEIERLPLSRIQQISGANLHRNWLNIPHVTNFDNADVTDLEAFRLAVNGEKRQPQVKLTMVAFMLKASALTLAAYPRFNSSLEGSQLIQKQYVHVGFAVDTPKGLMVPVIRDCDKKGLIEIATEMSALSEKARQGKLLPSDMEGGCFSVSSLGGIGGTGFTPIINAPEVAILGAARSQMQAVWDGKEFQPRLIMPMSLSWDHRVVDGVAAARFLGHLASLLGDFRRALL